MTDKDVKIRKSAGGDPAKLITGGENYENTFGRPGQGFRVVIP